MNGAIGGTVAEELEEEESAGEAGEGDGDEQEDEFGGRASGHQGLVIVGIGRFTR